HLVLPPFPTRRSSDLGYQPYLVQPNASPTDSKEAAAAAAAFRVLVGFADLPGLFPAQLPTLQSQYDTYIAGLPDDPPGSRAAGVDRKSTRLNSSHLVI